jgi:hypothetical protein
MIHCHFVHPSPTWPDVTWPAVERRHPGWDAGGRLTAWVRPSMRYHHVTFLNQTFECISCFSHADYIPRPSDHPWISVGLTTCMRGFLRSISREMCMFFRNPRKRENRKKYYKSPTRIKVESKNRKRRDTESRIRSTSAGAGRGKPRRKLSRPTRRSRPICQSVLLVSVAVMACLLLMVSLFLRFSVSEYSL